MVIFKRARSIYKLIISPQCKENSPFIARQMLTAAKTYLPYVGIQSLITLPNVLHSPLFIHL